MGILELFLLAVGLSMDAFAVSVCKGLCMRKMKYGQALVIALFFGGFQAGMPLIGWVLGKQFEKYITSIDHWIAFVLLGIIGFNMIREAVSKDEEEESSLTLENGLPASPKAIIIDHRIRDPHNLWWMAQSVD